MAKSAPQKARHLDTSLKNLSLATPPTLYSKAAPPPESWEEQASSSTSSSPSPISTTSPSTPPQDPSPGPPPPTPISPSHRRGKSTDWSAFSASSSINPPRSPVAVASSSSREDKRPEKSSATAGRLIAGALGVKAPKMGEEQRKYERAVREKERKRIERERGERERERSEAEEAKRTVWDG